MKYHYTAVKVETGIVMQNECNDAFIQAYCLPNNQNLNSGTLEKTSVNHTLHNPGKLRRQLYLKAQGLRFFKHRIACDSCNYHIFIQLLLSSLFGIISCSSKLHMPFVLGLKTTAPPTLHLGKKSREGSISAFSLSENICPWICLLWVPSLGFGGMDEHSEAPIKGALTGIVTSPINRLNAHTFLF